MLGTGKTGHDNVKLLLGRDSQGHAILSTILRGEMPNSLLLLFLAVKLDVFVTALGSCSPPRFDKFSERLIGPWTTAENEERSVEEVMRSCGACSY